MIYDQKNNTIKTDRLILRMFKETDADQVTALCNNYNIYKSTLTLPFPYTRDCAVDWIKGHSDNFEKNKLFEFAIVDKETDVIYGAIALSNNQKHHNGELAYWIGEAFWGQGIATEASKAMIDFAFTYKGYHKVYARYFASNPASGRIMEKVGMTQEGVLLEHVFKEDRFEDLIYYGIT